MAAIRETLFNGVRVKRLDDEGNSVMVYNVPVEVQLEYDPKGMLVKISEESEQKEFIVSKGSEFARVGRKGIIFKLSTETLLLTFASDEVNHFKDLAYRLLRDLVRILTSSLML